MPAENDPPAPANGAGDAFDAPADSSLENLRQILFHGQIEKLEDLETGLDDLERQINDEESLVKMIAPVLGDAIRLKIHEARDEMIEALYPIIGKVVQRAVMEAVSDLARSLDAQVKSSFDLRLAWWRMRARLGGASEAQIRLRERLPFTVTDILLIHRESGLLLFHLPGQDSQASDTDLFSGMLTAIRDFTQDTLGGDEGAGLGEITYGDQRILIETAEHAYLAVIVEGIAPPGFRDEMRERLFEVEHAHAEDLRSYQGDAGSLVPVKETLSPLMANAAPRKLSLTQKRFLAGALGGFSILLVTCCLFMGWVWQLARRSAPPPAAAVLPASTFTVTPPATASPTPTVTAASTSTASPTASAMASATPSLTITPLPQATQTASPAPALGVILGNVWMHAEPSPDSARTGIILTRGERVEILALDGDWVRVRRLAAVRPSAAGQEDAAGWIPARWLGTTSPIPAQLITPGAAP